MIDDRKQRSHVMQDHTSDDELRDRLSLIEKMIAEGRRETESWGWVFVLWGVVYYVAMAWSARGHTSWAWPVTMTAGVMITAAIAGMKAGSQPRTTLGRAVAAIWMAAGISMFLLFLSLGVSGRLSDRHIFVAVISAILGMANGASGLLLHWKVQLACAAAWWAATVASCFGSDEQNTMVFVVAIFLCQIVFGIYGVVAGAQQRRRRGPIHA
jgi:hypothetical protein